MTRGALSQKNTSHPGPPGHENAAANGLQIQREKRACGVGLGGSNPPYYPSVGLVPSLKFLIIIVSSLVPNGSGLPAVTYSDLPCLGYSRGTPFSSRDRLNCRIPDFV